jgi:iron(III) transport system permease protein
LGFLIFPWYVTGDGFFSINWIKEYSLEDYGSGITSGFYKPKILAFTFNRSPILSFSNT